MTELEDVNWFHWQGEEDGGDGVEDQSFFAFFSVTKPRLLCRVATSRTEEEPISKVQYKGNVN